MQPSAISHQPSAISHQLKRRTSSPVSRFPLPASRNSPTHLEQRAMAVSDVLFRDIRVLMLAARRRQTATH